MSLNRLFLFTSTLLMLCASVPQTPDANAQARPPLLVIVSSALGGSEIGLGTLRSAFQGNSTDLNGKRLIPFNQAPGSPERVRFDQVVLGLGPDQVARFWIDQRVRNGLQAPRTLQSPELALRLAASVPGIISYFAGQPSAVPKGLTALKIDGKAPTDSGYPLKGE